jgi:hypothetical protein
VGGEDAERAWGRPNCPPPRFCSVPADAFSRIAQERDRSRVVVVISTPPMLALKMSQNPFDAT